MNHQAFSKLLLYSRLTSVQWSGTNALLLGLKDPKGQITFEFVQAHFFTGMGEA